MPRRAEARSLEPEARSHEQSAVISRPRGKTPTSQTGAACVPSGQLFAASTGLMTAYCSCCFL